MWHIYVPSDLIRAVPVIGDGALRAVLGARATAAVTSWITLETNLHCGRGLLRGFRSCSLL